MFNKTKLSAAVMAAMLLTTAVPALIPVTASAESITYGYLTFDTETGTITGCGSASGELVIPNEINGVAVTAIGYKAFYKHSDITNITIPDSVTEIGNSAFLDCRGLTSISIPEGVTKINEETFEECRNLKSVSIPYSVTTIGKWAFNNCTSLTDVYYGGSVSDWENIRIDSVNTDLMFATRHYTKQGSCGDNLRWILDDTNTLTISGTGNMTNWTASSKLPWYSYRTDITSVVIEDGVTTIGNHAFDGCRSLQSISIPDSVTSIGTYSFCGCSSIERIDLPDGMTVIGDCAFSGCSKLTSINIPNSVTTIGDVAFGSCSSLQSISVPGSVTTIGDNPFYSCSSLISINVENNNNTYASYDGVLFSKDMTKIICCPGNKAGSYKIPDGVTTIGDAAFINCAMISSVSIPNSVTVIGGDAFLGCTGLTNITIPVSVMQIGFCAFWSCSNLTNIRYSGTAVQWSGVKTANDWISYECPAILYVLDVIPVSTDSTATYADNSANDGGTTGFAAELNEDTLELGNVVWTVTTSSNETRKTEGLSYNVGVISGPVSIGLVVTGLYDEAATATAAYEKTGYIEYTE